MTTYEITRRSILTFGVATFSGLGFSQTIERPLSIIVPQPAGNPTDGIARKIQPLIQKDLGQTVIVENIPGAGGALGVQKVLGMPAGSPVLLIASQTEPILTPLAVSAARYKSEDLRPIALMGRTPYLLVGRADLPANTLSELLELAKRSAGSKPLTHGHIGPGSMIHLLGEQLSKKSGAAITQVPYKGVPPLIQDLMGGQIDLAFLPQGGSIPTLVDTGKLRVYGTTFAEPSKRLPKVIPISRHNANFSDFIYGTWASALVPRNLPVPLVQKLHETVAKALADSDVKAYSTESGIEVADPMTLTQLDRFYQSETKVHRALASEIDLKPQ